MAKSGGGMGLVLLGGGALALALLSSKKAEASAPALPAGGGSKPPPLPAPDPDGEGEGDAGGSSAPSSSTPERDEPAAPAPAQLSQLDADERAAAIAAARKAKAKEDAEAAAVARAAAKPAPTVDSKGTLHAVDENEPAPTEDSHAAEPEGGMRTAPFESMPAEKPATLPSSSKFDKVAARRMAPTVANNIANKKASYDRKQLASFQEKAGLTGDGIYGPLSVSALKFYGVKAPPKALFKGGKVSTYTPPA